MTTLNLTKIYGRTTRAVYGMAVAGALLLGTLGTQNAHATSPSTTVEQVQATLAGQRAPLPAAQRAASMDTSGLDSQTRTQLVLLGSHSAAPEVARVGAGIPLKNAGMQPQVQETLLGIPRVQPSAINKGLVHARN